MPQSNPRRVLRSFMGAWDRHLLRFAAALATIAGVMSAVFIVGIVHTALFGDSFRDLAFNGGLASIMLLGSVATLFGVLRALPGARPITPHALRVAIGFVSGGYTSTVLIVAIPVLWTLFSGDEMGCMGRWAAIMFALVVGLYLSSTVTIGLVVLVGLPFYFLSRRYGWASARAYMLFGIGVSVAVLVLELVIRLVVRSKPAVHIDFEGAAIMVLILLAAPLATTVFWLIARPDRSATQAAGTGR